MVECRVPRRADQVSEPEREPKFCYLERIKDLVTYRDAVIANVGLIGTFSSSMKACRMNASGLQWLPQTSRSTPLQIDWKST